MKTTRGDILHATGLICIPVNMVGVAGAGLAKQWADLEPDRAFLYRKLCETNRIREHTILIDFYWMLPTKDHWKESSDADAILTRVKQDLDVIGKAGWKTINLPKIGCGLGGLDWETFFPQLKPLLTSYEEEHQAEVVLYT